MIQSFAANSSETSSSSEKMLSKLSYNAVKRTFIEKYGDLVFQQCKHDVQAALEELSFRQDRIQPFWNRTRGGMKAFLLQEEVVEMNQHAKQQRAIKGRFGRPNMGVRSTSKSFSTKRTKTKQTHHDLTKSAYPRGPKESQTPFRLATSEDLTPCVVFLALVDTLQVWNVDKKLENAVKTRVIEPILHQNLHADISAIEPELYKERFFEMVKSRVLSMEDVGNFSNTDIVKNWLNIADNSNGMSNQQRSNSTKVLKKMDGKAGELTGISAHISHPGLDD